MEQFVLNDNQKLLIEKLGRAIEKSGLQPVASRISALLLISDKNELTFDEIKDSMNLSKSSTSNAINLLLGLERIEYITKLGDRKRYFRSKITSLKTNLDKHFDDFIEINETLREVVKNKINKDDQFTKDLIYMIELTQYIFDKIPKIICEFENKNEINKE